MRTLFPLEVQPTRLPQYQYERASADIRRSLYRGVRLRDVRPVLHSIRPQPKLIRYCICRLYGVTNLQVFVYFNKYHHDRPWNKLITCWLWSVRLGLDRALVTRSLCTLRRALDSLHVVLCIYMLYWYLVTSYGNVLDLLEVHWSFRV